MTLQRLRRRISGASRRIRRRVSRRLPRRGFRSRPFGVNLIGVDGTHSIGVMTRDYCSALESAGVPVTLILTTTSSATGRSPIAIPRRIRLHAVTILLPSPLFWDIRALPDRITRGTHVIANWIWEQTQLPAAVVDALEVVDEVWASSRFVADAYSAVTDRPVVLIPHPVRAIDPDLEPLDRHRFGIPRDALVFMTIAAASSSFTRKNPLGALHAFRRAFPDGASGAVLVIKLLDNEFNPSEQAQRELFVADPAFGPDIILVHGSFTDDEMTALVGICDCFISLHRAEGFGLGAAEAMQLGRPVIVTDWSGPADYLTVDNSLPVPYTLETFDDPGMWPYLPGLPWAEPDLDVAAEHIRAIASDPELRSRLGRRAALDIEQQHSVRYVGQVMESKLRSLVND